MYFTVSSIIIVVWHLQMKGKLSKNELQIMAVQVYTAGYVHMCTLQPAGLG